MRTRTAIVLGAFFAAACAAALAAQAASANAQLKDREGKTVGTARFSQAPHGLLLTLDFTALPPGEHSVHLHATGKCDPPDFKTAGGHFNPAGAQHGFKNPKGPHAGDLPNLHVPESGRLTVEYMLPDVTLEGGKLPLLDADGAAVVVHAKADDYTTDPAGAAGDRIACGVVSK